MLSKPTKPLSKSVKDLLFVPRLCCRIALCFSSPPEAKPEWRQSEGRAKALWEDESEIGHLSSVSNAKIARINDIANFFKQKKSLFPLLKKRGSLWWQKRLSLVTRG